MAEEEVDKKADRLKTARARAQKLLETETDGAPTPSIGMDLGGAVMGAFSMGREPDISHETEGSLTNSAISGLEDFTTWATMASSGVRSDSWFGLSSRGATIAGDVPAGKTDSEAGTGDSNPGSRSMPPLLSRNSFGGSFSAALFGDEEVDSNEANDAAARKAAARNLQRAQSERESAALRRAAAAEALDTKVQNCCRA